jgi:hypothetical protein
MAAAAKRRNVTAFFTLEGQSEKWSNKDKKGKKKIVFDEQNM